MLKHVCWLGLSLALAGIYALPVLADGTDTQKSDDAMRQMRPAFSDIDTNKDGVISQAEFDAFHPEKPDHEMPPNDHWRRHGGRDGPMPFRGPDLKQLDKDKDGKISLEEFVAPMKARFARMDVNQDGFLDEAELNAPSSPPE